MTLRRVSQKSAGGVALRVLGFVVIAAVAAGAYSALRGLGRWFGDADEQAPRVVERAAPSVVTAIQSLARLESVSFHIERVVDLKQKEQTLWGLAEAEDSILLVAAGDVLAGVDLGKLREGDITLHETTQQVRIVMPPPEVFWSRLDSQRTYVHSRKTDLLATGGQGLETEARKRAEVSIHDAALKAGILEHARRNATHTVRALAMSFGYQTAIIEWRRE